MNLNGDNSNDDSSYMQTPSAKRQKKEQGGNEFQQKPPSFVVHARNLVENVGEENIYDALEQYGDIIEIVLMPKKRQALIEFEDIDSAINCVNDASQSGIYICGAAAYFNYSSHQKITKQANRDLGDVEEKKVLLMNVLNPLYPITVNVIHTICSPYGKVLRILIFRKNAVQVMLEYENAECAAKAKEELDGAEIYSDCCILKIDFAKINRLNVIRNDTDSWDFTLTDSTQSTSNQNIDKSNQDPSDLQSDNYKYQSTNRNTFATNKNNNTQNNSIQTNKPTSKIPSLMSSGDGSFTPNLNEISSQPYTGNQIVLSAHNLCPEKFNCDRLFNLLSLYGNVDKIKFLLSKEGSAMLQMSNAEPLYSVLGHLNNTYVFGKKIQLHIGKQNILQPVTKPIDLKDGSTSYKEYIANRNNRYQTAEAAQKNKPLAPSNILYWYNAPPGTTEQQIYEIFSNVDAKKTNQSENISKEN